MWPVPYIGMQIVHDQEIKEALDRSRFSEAAAVRNPQLLTTMRAWLARFADLAAWRSRPTSFFKTGRDMVAGKAARSVSLSLHVNFRLNIHVSSADAEYVGE
ncbi:hypothetical protein [Dictyobacter aurantiacus]|uniref:Uncharacterized protein n=1 Tax=Dictyobacter aurantiacus TaxID=1936993 RepID=A0A401ZKB3_9CHLR|nr:hypothetical protein [Dictyobacter aurantiacus]GCE07254.1 hypothetical protein KDAU_45830 [Dictyobacter aurantiacus]